RGSGVGKEVAEVRPTFGMRRAALIALGAAVIATAGCDSDDSSAPGSTVPGVYSLTVGVTSESGTLSTIAIDLGPASVDGNFVTDGGRPDCEILTPGAFGVWSVLDIDRIRIGVASFSGFDTPVELARCKFDARERVAPSDFSAELVDASAPDGDPPSPAPVVELTAVTAEETPTSTTILTASSTTTVPSAD
ncbi:MAG TPA: hypothetical protein VFO62_00815, partial [Candidatus Binatia bacterium]|nr:hypothetical protein [Candidatus Binatia bacterium]